MNQPFSKYFNLNAITCFKTLIDLATLVVWYSVSSQRQLALILFFISTVLFVFCYDKDVSKQRYRGGVPHITQQNCKLAARLSFLTDKTMNGIRLCCSGSGRAKRRRAPRRLSARDLESLRLHASILCFLQHVLDPSPPVYPDAATHHKRTSMPVPAYGYRICLLTRGDEMGFAETESLGISPTCLIIE